MIFGLDVVLIPINKLLKGHFLIKLRLVTPTGDLNIDIRQRMIFIILMSHYIAQTTILHQYLDPLKKIIYILVQFVI